MKSWVAILALGTWTTMGWSQSVSTSTDSMKLTPPANLRQAILQEKPKAENLHFQLRKRHLPFFCEAEAKWDKKSDTKLRFRLGSQEYVDRLEGKLD